MKMVERFWSKVKKTRDCWLWTAAKSGDGYGRFSIGGKLKSAHRLSWEINNSPIPHNLHVLHRCDNPSCVRPEHLFLGTHAENMADRDQKSRLVRGEKQITSKLTEKQVKEIREKYQNRTTATEEIGKNYSVSGRTIRHILLRKTWKHI